MKNKAGKVVYETQYYKEKNNKIQTCEFSYNDNGNLDYRQIKEYKYGKEHLVKTTYYKENGDLDYDIVLDNFATGYLSSDIFSENITIYQNNTIAVNNSYSYDKILGSLLSQITEYYDKNGNIYMREWNNHKAYGEPNYTIYFDKNGNEISEEEFLKQKDERIKNFYNDEEKNSIEEKCNDIIRKHY